VRLGITCRGIILTMNFKNNQFQGSKLKGTWPDIDKFHCDLDGHFILCKRKICHKGRLFEKIPTLTGITHIVCPKSSCSGLAEEWDVNWWHTPPALLTQQDPVDVQ